MKLVTMSKRSCFGAYSMGSPLGPTFANYYMCYLENKLLNQSRISNPFFYLRYVDDIFVIFNAKNHYRYFINRLEKESVLKFTHEFMENNTFNFLDIKLDFSNDGNISTSVYVKPTDKGIYANFHSHIPQQYKKSVINTLINRALKYSSSWETCHAEFNRIRQVFSNNNYPQALIDENIEKKVSAFFAQSSSSTKPESIYFFCAVILSQ